MNFSEPDGTIEMVGNREWARIHPKRCPHCGATFWAWKPLDSTWQPHTVDPEPRLGHGMRETCGSPGCWETEQTHQFNRLIAYRKTHAKTPKQDPSRRL